MNASEQDATREVIRGQVLLEREACAALIEHLHEGIAEIVSPRDLADAIRNREKFAEITQAELQRARTAESREQRAAERRYLKDARFHGLVRQIIAWLNDGLITFEDIRQALHIVERIHIVQLPKVDQAVQGKNWREVAGQLGKELASFKFITGQAMPMPVASVEGESVKVGPEGGENYSNVRLMMDNLRRYKEATIAGNEVMNELVEAVQKGDIVALPNKVTVTPGPSHFWCSGCQQMKPVLDATTLERALALRADGKMLCQACDADTPQLISKPEKGPQES